MITSSDPTVTYNDLYSDLLWPTVTYSDPKVTYTYPLTSTYLTWSIISLILDIKRSMGGGGGGGGKVTQPNLV